MPQAAGAWIAAYFYGLGWSLAASQIAGMIAYAAVVMAISVALSEVSTALMGRPKSTSSMGSRKLTIRDSVHPRTILYGEGRTGGVLVYINTCGVRNEYLDFVIAIAGHQITEITDVWFAETKIEQHHIGGGSAAGGIVNSGDYAKHAWIYKYLGTDDQLASTLLVASYPNKEWASTAYGRGTAYVHIRLLRDVKVFDQGPPNNFTFGFKGAQVYDPRKDSTNGGTGSHRIDTPSTWEYSKNPALCVADYTMGGTIVNTGTRVNMRGFGADPGDVDWASVIAAANICDEDVVVPGSPSTTQNRYECDGALSMGETPADNLDQLMTSMMGQLTYASGKYRMFAGAYAPPATTLVEADLAGPIEYVTGASRSVRYNAVKGTRYDTETGQEVEFISRLSPTYEAEDGGARLYRDIELPFTLNEYRAQRIAQIILRRSREQATLVWRGNLGCLRVAVWETVYVTLPELGLTDKVFRCISREFKPSTEGDPIVELTLREENSTTHTDPLVADYDDLTPADPDPTPPDFFDDPTNMSVVYDPEFMWGLEGEPLYWDIAGNAVWTDNLITLTADGVTAPQARTTHLTVFPATVTAGWVLSFTVRYRVSSALTGANKRLYVRVWTSGEDFGAGATLCDSKAIDLTTATLNAWYVEQFSLNYAPDGTYDRVRVQLIVDAADVSAGAVQIDHCYAFRQSQTIDPGDLVEPITGYLTNEAVTLAASAAGVVGSFATATGTFKVFEGQTDVSSLASFVEVSETNCTGTIHPTTGVYSVTALSANSGAYTVSATYSGVTITKTFSLSKAIAGTESPPSLTLSRYSASVVAYADGSVPSYAAAAGQATVMSGTVNVTTLSTLTAVATGCTGTINSSGAYSVTAMSATTASLRISATYAGTTVVADFVIGKLIVGYETVTALPSTNLFDGRIVYYSGKLYRYVGTPPTGAWTVSVDAADISVGKITAAQMATGTITAASAVLGSASIQEANIVDLNVTNIKIANGAVSGTFLDDSNLGGGAVNTTLAANPVVAGRSYEGSVTGANVSISGVTASQTRVHVAASMNVYNPSTTLTIACTLFLRRSDGLAFIGPDMSLPVSTTSGRLAWQLPNWNFVDSNPIAGTSSYQLCIATQTAVSYGRWTDVRLVAGVFKK